MDLASLKGKTVALERANDDFSFAEILQKNSNILDKNNTLAKLYGAQTSPYFFIINVYLVRVGN